MSQAEKLLYTARVHTIGSRELGTSCTDDRRLNIQHSVPGAPGNGTNPEQLFAPGWSTCFERAMAIAARKKKNACPADLAIHAEVDLNTNEGGYCCAAASKSACRSGSSSCTFDRAYGGTA